MTPEKRFQKHMSFTNWTLYVCVYSILQYLIYFLLNTVPYLKGIYRGIYVFTFTFIYKNAI